MVALSYAVLNVAGTKVEGILRQSADVEEVERRVQDYEQGPFCLSCYFIIFWFCVWVFLFNLGGVSLCFSGNNEFDPNEDAHVIGDCVKVW